MELKQVIKQILPVYEQALVDMPKEGHYEWLKDRGMNTGICKYANVSSVDTFIYNLMDLVTEKEGYLNNDCPMPNYTYPENLQQIQNRVDWMREYLTKTDQ